MIELPSGFTSGLASSTNAQIANFSPLLLLVMGLLLAVVAIGFIVRFIHK